MPKYRYRAVNAQGIPSRGVLEATNEADLTARLEEGGLSLIDCKAISEKAGKLVGINFKRVKLRDLIQMFVQLQQLQKAGVPLMTSLMDIRDNTESPRLRDVVSDVHREVTQGTSFSSALATQPRVFEPVIIALINAGEETGNLIEAFDQAIKHLKWSDDMRRKIKKATRYPMILCVVVIAVIWLMMGLVVPEVTGFLIEAGRELPDVTLALIATSEFFVNYFLYILMGLVVLFVGILTGRATSKKFLYMTDNVLLRLPVLGIIIRKIAISQFAQTFGVLFTSGLDVLKCLSSATLTAGNAVIMESLNTVREEVQNGLPLSAALQNSGEFPSMVIRMVRVGEESGNLTEIMSQVSEFYDKDVNDAVDSMIELIEPTLTAVLGGIILWIAAAVFGPIYDMIGEMEI